MFLNFVILSLLLYLWYSFLVKWNPVLWFFLIFLGLASSLFSKYNSIFFLFSSLYFLYDYTVNYAIKKEEIQQKVNQKLKEQNTTDIIKYLV